MESLEQLLQRNGEWAAALRQQNPQIFAALAREQKPYYLWIGCSDSRVPAEQICGVGPGEFFVHRNIANRVSAEDLSALSVVEYAVDVLRVEHIIVCGHYGCGGVKAALDGAKIGQMDAWIDGIKKDLSEGRDLSWNAAVELHVKKQVQRLGRLELIQRAWQRGQALSLHGWVYQLEDGCLKDLNLTMSAPSDGPK